jgi:V/A-type H+-transporting ATPase subunit B
MGEMVEVLLPEGTARRGQVIEFSDRHTVIQILEESTGIGVRSTRIRFTGSPPRIPLSPDILGRRFNGAGDPVDGLPAVLPETWESIMGTPINPVARDKPSHFIRTGISAIDGLNTLVRGQKLPIFSGAGLPAREIAGQILRHAGPETESRRGPLPAGSSRSSSPPWGSPTGKRPLSWRSSNRGAPGSTPWCT